MLDLADPGADVGPALLDVADHRFEPMDLATKCFCLPIGQGQEIREDLDSLRSVADLPELLALPGPDIFVFGGSDGPYCFSIMRESAVRLRRKRS